MPTLPTDIIRNLLLVLKPHGACDEAHIDSCVDIPTINLILSQVKRPSRLLTDYLACAGLQPVHSA